MEITLIRHLPTAWNHQGLLQGQRDIPICEKTLEGDQTQIEKNCRQLQQTGPFGIVLASSLRRAQQTAHVYGYQDPVIEPLLNELDFGAFEGHPKKELVSHFGDSWYNQPREIALGEGVATLEKRVLLVLRHYKNFQRILIFGHGSWIRALLSINQQGDVNNMNRVKVDNNERIQLTMEGERDESTINA